MTVQELIDELQKVEDKTLQVVVYKGYEMEDCLAHHVEIDESDSGGGILRIEPSMY